MSDPERAQSAHSPFPDATFWAWIHEFHVLDESGVEAYLKRAQDLPWRSIGRILIEQEVITVDQVMRILEIQSEEPGALLGALAVREGYCTSEEIQACLDFQHSTEEGPLEWLLADPAVDSRLLAEALVAYAKHLEGALTNLRQGIESPQDG